MRADQSKALRANLPDAVTQAQNLLTEKALKVGMRLIEEEERPMDFARDLGDFAEKSENKPLLAFAHDLAAYIRMGKEEVGGKSFFDVFEGHGDLDLSPFFVANDHWVGALKPLDAGVTVLKLLEIGEKEAEKPIPVVEKEVKEKKKPYVKKENVIIFKSFEEVANTYPAIHDLFTMADENVWQKFGGREALSRQDLFLLFEQVEASDDVAKSKLAVTQGAGGLLDSFAKSLGKEVDDLTIKLEGKREVYHDKETVKDFLVFAANKLGNRKTPKLKITDLENFPVSQGKKK